MVNKDSGRNQGSCKRADAPGKVEKGKDGRATLRKRPAGKKSDSGHGHSNAYAQHEEYRLEKKPWAHRDCNARAAHSHKPDGHGPRVVLSAQECSDRSARKIQQEEEAGGRIGQVKTRGKRWEERSPNNVKHTGKCEYRVKDEDGSSVGTHDHTAIESVPAAARALGIGGTGRFANDQFRVDGNEIWESRLAANSLQENSRCRCAHLVERLTNRR